MELPRVKDVDPVRKREHERQLALKLATENGVKENEEKPAYNAQAEFQNLTLTRSGGVYMPPSCLLAMQANVAKDKTSPEYQRTAWDALRKSITGIINKVNISNIKDIIPELFKELDSWSRSILLKYYEDAGGKFALYTCCDTFCFCVVRLTL